jgi:ADP-ribose pyrophosphatase YjhB (NUDIX family)
VGWVEHIHIATAAGRRMTALAGADARPGVGLLGDRYAAGAGYWRDDRVSRDVTLVEAETIEHLADRGISLEPGELRRNVTTRGVGLNDLVGRLFWADDVLCRGTQLCEPCRHLEELTGKRLLRPLVHRGGLRAELMSGGTIRVGDAVEEADELPGVGVLVVRDGNVLLGRRLSPHGYGTWSCPGGKPHAGETTVDCALRELAEETGLKARGPRVVFEVVDGFPESRLVYRTRFVEVDAVGSPSVCEPDKTEGWQWHPWSSLPAPLFAPVASLADARARGLVHGEELVLALDHEV